MLFIRKIHTEVTTTSIVSVLYVRVVGRERKQGLLTTINVTFSTVHEVGREQGVLNICVVFSTVYEVGREQGVLTISGVVSTVHEVGREQGVLTIQEYVLSQAPTNQVGLYFSSIVLF